jgi:hypothetical protein
MEKQARLLAGAAAPIEQRAGTRSDRNPPFLPLVRRRDAQLRRVRGGNRRFECFDLDTQVVLALDIVRSCERDASLDGFIHRFVGLGCFRTVR